LLQWCLHNTRWCTWSKIVWPPTIATPRWWFALPTQQRKHDQEGKANCATTTTPPFYLHKMKPWIEGEKLWAPTKVILPHHNDNWFCLHKWNHEQEGKKWWAFTTTWSLHHNDDKLCSMPTQNENMNMREKNYGHLCSHRTTIMIDVTQSPMPTQNQTVNMKIIKNFFEHLPMHDCHTMKMIWCCLVPTQNENLNLWWTQSKKYGNELYHM